MGKAISMPLQPKPTQAFVFVDLPAIQEMLSAETMYCVHCGALVLIYPPKEAGAHDLEFHADRLGEGPEFTAKYLTSPERTPEEMANICSNYVGAILQTRADLRRRALLAGWIKLVNERQPQGKPF